MIQIALLQLQDRSQLEQYLRTSNDPLVLATALSVAFFLGAAHALTPGHGKAIVAAYLVGSRGRVLDAVYLGAVVTATHTAVVFLVGLASLYASRTIAVDRIFPWLSVLSGVLVAAVGLWLFYQRSQGHGYSHNDHHHHHGHEHHDHGHDHHHHNHGHHHRHEDGRGGLLSLGISGGMVPCPEAFVVLIAAISLGRVLLGLALLTAFSLGLATVLIAIGIAMVMAGPAMRKVAGDGPWIRRLPVLSALVVTVIGLALIVQASRAL